VSELRETGVIAATPATLASPISFRPHHHVVRLPPPLLCCSAVNQRAGSRLILCSGIFAAIWTPHRLGGGLARSRNSVFSLRRPSDEFIRRFLSAQSGLDFTYAAVGATGKQPPAGHVVDHTRVKLGDGKAAFKAAAAAIRRWEQFGLGWLSASPGDTPIEPGRCVAVLARAVGLWCLNAAKIIYVVEEPRRFGFAYGTLPGHVESGEERFLIEQADDDSVWYDILAFSRPNHVLTRLGYPFVRRLQKRFGRDSAAAMVRVVQTD
jgi:uncharacterized protein (UPF0548 family)